MNWRLKVQEGLKHTTTGSTTDYKSLLLQRVTSHAGQITMTFIFLEEIQLDEAALQNNDRHTQQEAAYTH